MIIGLRWGGGWLHTYFPLFFLKKTALYLMLHMLQRMYDQALGLGVVICSEKGGMLSKMNNSGLTPRVYKWVKYSKMTMI